MVELRLANMCSGHLCYRRPFRLLHEEEEEEASLDDHETDSKDLSEDADAVQADDSCEYSNDGECDEPEYCMMGTDTTDCNSELDSQGIRRQGAGSRGGCATERRRKRRRKRSPGLDDCIQHRRNSCCIDSFGAHGKIEAQLFLSSSAPTKRNRKLFAGEFRT